MRAPASSTAAVSAMTSLTVRLRAGSTAKEFRRAIAKRIRPRGVLVRSSLYASPTTALHETTAPAPRAPPPPAPPDARSAQPRGRQTRGHRHLHVSVRLPLGGPRLDVGGLPELRRVPGLVGRSLRDSLLRSLRCALWP